MNPIEIDTPAPTVTGNFHCYTCRRNITSVNADYTCPLCSTGFIEITDEQQQQQQQQQQQIVTGWAPVLYTNGQPYSYTGGTAAAAAVLPAYPREYDVTPRDPNVFGRRRLYFINDEPEFYPGTADMDSFRETYNIRAADLGGSQGAASSSSAPSSSSMSDIGYMLRDLQAIILRRSNDSARQFLNSLDALINQITDLPRISGGGGVGDGSGPSTSRASANNNNNNNNNNANDNTSVSGAGGGGGVTSSWTREDVGFVLNQFVNQLTGVPPPPLNVDRIKSLPLITIGSEHVDAKMQCSVCLDYFLLGESVHKISCQHIYHKKCIIPWLRIHATCPVCRKVLAEDSNSIGGNDDIRQHLWNVIRNLEREVQP